MKGTNMNYKFMRGSGSFNNQVIGYFLSPVFVSGRNKNRSQNLRMIPFKKQSAFITRLNAQKDYETSPLIDLSEQTFIDWKTVPEENKPSKEILDFAKLVPDMDGFPMVQVVGTENNPDYKNKMKNLVTTWNYYVYCLLQVNLCDIAFANNLITDIEKLYKTTDATEEGIRLYKKRFPMLSSLLRRERGKLRIFCDGVKTKLNATVARQMYIDEGMEEGDIDELLPVVRSYKALVSEFSRYTSSRNYQLNQPQVKKDKDLALYEAFVKQEFGIVMLIRILTTSDVPTSFARTVVANAYQNPTFANGKALRGELKRLRKKLYSLRVDNKTSSLDELFGLLR
jgi:hypothetical protein